MSRLNPGNFTVFRLCIWWQSRIILLLSVLLLFTPAVVAQDDNAIIRPGLKKGMLLVASKRLLDPYFGQTVILLTQYDRRGTSGIILNRQSEIPLSSAFPEILKRLPMLENLFIGGPVASSRISLLIHSERNIEDANEVMENIYHIDNRELFQELEFDDLEATNTRLFSGFAGWAPGQLESEMKRGDWHTWHATASIIFSQTPRELWNELIDLASAKWVLR